MILELNNIYDYYVPDIKIAYRRVHSSKFRGPSRIEQDITFLQPFAVPKARHEKLPFLGTVCRIHIAHSIHVRSG